MAFTQSGSFVQPRLASPQSFRNSNSRALVGRKVSDRTLEQDTQSYNGLGTGLQLAREFDAGNTQGTRILHEWEGELMIEEEKRLTGRVSTLRRLLPPFVCAIYNGQARDWDREAVLSMLTGKNNLKGEDLPARLTEGDVMAYIDKLLAQRESKIHT